MSMFDGYIPDAPMHCPKCGKPLREWQGKDGPCSLLVWRQGRTQPVGFTPDAGVIDSFPKGHRSRERLPERFKIHTSDCGKHWIDAIGECFQ